MYFMSKKESDAFVEWSDNVIRGESEPLDFRAMMRPVLLPVFYFYCGVLLCKLGQVQRGMDCFRRGSMYESDNMFSNAFVASFLERHNYELMIPAVCFEDPLPFVHFSTTPELKTARKNFIIQAGRSLPRLDRPFRLMDIGTGNGVLAVELLQHLKRCDIIKEVEDILLIDSSPAMLELASAYVGENFPDANIETLQGRIQDVVDDIDGVYDAALCSLSYHHMPMADKRLNLVKLKDKFNNLLLFELNADNDLPELDSPELMLAVYQSYGAMIDCIFAHDAPLEVTIDAVDSFLMTEQMSFLLQSRGERSDYHATRGQWTELFDDVLRPEFECFCDGSCMSDDYYELFILHYGRLWRGKKRGK